MSKNPEVPLTDRLHELLRLTNDEQHPNINALWRISKDIDGIKLNIKAFGYDLARRLAEAKPLYYLARWTSTFARYNRTISTPRCHWSANVAKDPRCRSLEEATSPDMTPASHPFISHFWSPRAPSSMSEAGIPRLALSTS